MFFLKFTLLKWDIQLPFHLALQHLYCCHFKIFLAIVIVSMMANEYSYGTLKQNLIDGLSKRSSFCLNFDRTLFSFCSTTVFVFVMSLILGFVFSSYTELPSSFLEWNIWAFFVKLVGFSPFVCFRHTGKAICICPWFSLVWNIIGESLKVF
jgi:hypothetical protein